MSSSNNEDNSDRIRSLLETAPFRTFRIRTTDGSDYSVDKSYQAMLTSLTLHLYDDNHDNVFYIVLTEIVFVSQPEQAVA